MSDSAPLIHLEDVSRVFGGGEGGASVVALRGISLRIGEGEFVCITGPSGSGKSTLMNILGCLDQPSGGSYRLADREVGRLGADALAWLRRRMFGFVFQSYNLLESVTAQENVELPGRYARLSAESRRTRAQELLGGMGLLERADHLPGELSGGEQQRVAIARALMNGGRVILADEPTGALDRTNGEEVLSALEALAAQGHTVVIISHDREIAARARRCIELRDGRVVADTGRDSGLAQGVGEAPQARRQGMGGTAAEAMRAGLLTLRSGLRPGSRLRAFLPMICVLIGVMLSTAALFVGEGVYRELTGDINMMGLDSMSVSGMGNSLTEGALTLEDAAAIERDIPNVRAVTAMFVTGPAVVRHQDKAMEVQVWAYVDTGSKGGRSTLGYRMGEGDFVTLEEDRNLDRVIVIGSNVRKELFAPETDPIGQFIQLDNVPFQVKGVLKRRATDRTFFDPKEQERINEIVYPPPSTALALLYPQEQIGRLDVTVRDVDQIHDTADAIRDLGIKRYGAEAYGVNYAADFVARGLQLQNQVRLALGSIAGVALLAGNASVIAIMLMAVRARRREIGLRMAVGARRGDILRQFFSEALVLTVVGALMGMLVAGASILALRFFNIPTSVAWWHFALPFACAVVVAIPFAVIPAHRASRLNPVAALSES